MSEDRLCPCGKPLRADNKSGLCWLCQKANRSLRLCSCGCGDRIGRYNLTGYAFRCRLRLRVRAFAAA